MKKCHFEVRRSYFSLTELLVVIVIIGLVLGLVGPALFKMLFGAQHDIARDQCKLLKQCVSNYYLDNNEYPRSLDDLVTNPGSTKSWRGPYIEDGVLPKDPWGSDYQYSTPGKDSRPFEIYSYGADRAPGGEGENADVYHWETKH